MSTRSRGCGAAAVERRRCRRCCCSCSPDAGAANRRRRRRRRWTCWRRPPPRARSSTAALVERHTRALLAGEGEAPLPGRRAAEDRARSRRPEGFVGTALRGQSSRRASRRRVGAAARRGASVAGQPRLRAGARRPCPGREAARAARGVRGADAGRAARRAGVEGRRRARSHAARRWRPARPRPCPTSSDALGRRVRTRCWCCRGLGSDSLRLRRRAPPSWRRTAGSWRSRGSMRRRQARWRGSASAPGSSGCRAWNGAATCSRCCSGLSTPRWQPTSSAIPIAMWSPCCRAEATAMR